MKKNSRKWELYEATLASKNIKVIYIVGPPGVGKTYGALKYGRVQDGVFACTITEETSAAELRGFYQMKGGQTEWVDGPFIEAMKKGVRLVINEPSHASGDVLHLLYPLLESEATARLTLPTGETVVAEDGFHVVLTDNEPPEKLPEALQDRLNAIIDVDEPHPEALAALDDDLREVAGSAMQIDDDRRISARDWLNIQALREEFGLKNACILTFGSGRGEMVFDAIKLVWAHSRRPKKK